MKFILLFLILLMFLISFTSAITKDDVFNYWKDRGLSDSEAKNISEGNYKLTEQKIIQEEKQVAINQTLLAEQEAEKQKIKKDSWALLFISIFSLIVFGFVAGIIFLFISWGFGR